MKTTTCAILALVAPCALAEPILLIHEGSGSGFLNGVPFDDAPFTITATAETTERESFGIGFSVDHRRATIEIAGIGAVDFVTPTRTFVNRNSRVVGFSRAEGIESDLFSGPEEDDLRTWRLDSDVGPISGTGRLLQWRLPEVVTTEGVLFFETIETDATFTAIIPAPGTGGVLILLGARRRRRA